MLSDKLNQTSQDTSIHTHQNISCDVFLSYKIHQKKGERDAHMYTKIKDAYKCNHMNLNELQLFIHTIKNSVLARLHE